LFQLLTEAVKHPVRSEETQSLPISRKFAYTASVLFFIIVLTEVGVRAVITNLRGPLLHETDAQLGYRLRSGLDVCDNRYGRTWCFTTDQEGRRTIPGNPSRGQAKTVVVLGDSFAFGVGVDDDQTFAARLAESGFHVVNLAVQGYGTHQQLITFRRLLKSTRADFVVTLTYRNDVTDVVSSFQNMRHQPTASLAEGQLRIDEFRPPIVDFLIDYSYLAALSRYPFNQPKRHSGDGPAIVAECLKAIETDARDSGIMPVFFAHDLEHSENGSRLLEAFNKRGLPVTELTTLLRADKQGVRGPDNRHWNARGHRIVGDAILAAGLASR
jgi:hypothetical protein